MVRSLWQVKLPLQEATIPEREQALDWPRSGIVSKLELRNALIHDFSDLFNVVYPLAIPGSFLAGVGCAVFG